MEEVYSGVRGGGGTERVESKACCTRSPRSGTDIPQDHGTHLAKLARFCVTLAMSVRVRAVRSSGYSWSRLKSEGDMIAGQRKRRKREALMSRSLMSGRPRLLHSCRQEANTSLSSRGKTLSRDRQRWAWGSGRGPGPDLVLSHMEP